MQAQRRPKLGDKDYDDEQFARDVQLAFELQAKEEQKALRRMQRTNNYTNNNNDDASIAASSRLNADHMLFVSCTLDDKQDIKLLVDTGASSSAMSLDMVTNLGLLPKLNRSVYGSAQGVGSSNIVGIVENVDLMIHHVEFQLYFMVIDSAMPCCILGLDQMRKYKCLVDLDSNALIFGGKDGVSVPFLPQEQAQQVAQQMMLSSAAAAASTSNAAASSISPSRQQEQDESDTFEGKLKSFFQSLT